LPFQPKPLGETGPHPPPAPGPEAPPSGAAQPAPKVAPPKGDDMNKEVRKLFDTAARIRARWN
jgi:hypothetical protein